MSAKKTFSNWLTTKYLLIIRNEENFAEKHTYGFNYARVILIGLVVFVIALALATVLIRGVLQQWLDPRYSERESRNQLIEMRLGMDSLKYKLISRDIYIENISKILSGGLNSDQIDSLASPEIMPEIVLEEQLQPIDSQFRAEFENSELLEVSFEGRTFSNEFRSIYLFSPMEGRLSDNYNPKEGHFGIDLVGVENEPVKAVADGIVILASWTLDGGHVIGIQHRAGLVSIYKHNSEILKNVGNFVTGGEIIAIIGNSGELTNGPHLHFELWHNSNPVNPEEYVGF
ncbi:MAG: M23 family metallopeptidase [Cytophagales bacterium]|nr:M23 family metallopeptidase [Cytophagales bacterium]